MSPLGRLLVSSALKTDPNEIPPEERVLKTLPRKAQRLPRREIARHRHRVVVGGSAARRQDPERHRRRLSRGAAATPSCSRTPTPPTGWSRRSPISAEAGEGCRGEGRHLPRAVGPADRAEQFGARHQQLSELSTELSRVRANRAPPKRPPRACARAGRAALAGRAAGGAVVRADPAAARDARCSSRPTSPTCRRTLLDNHPRIRALRSQLADLDGQIRSEAQKVLEGPGDAGADRAVPREAADRRPQHAEGAVGAGRRRRGRAQRAGARGRRPARAAGILSDALPRGIVAQGPQLLAGRCAHLLARRGAGRALFPEAVPIVGAAFVGSLLVMAIVTLLQELFSGRAMRPARGPRFEPVADIEMPPRRPSSRRRVATRPRRRAARSGPTGDRRRVAACFASRLGEDQRRDGGRTADRRRRCPRHLRLAGRRRGGRRPPSWWRAKSPMPGLRVLLARSHRVRARPRGRCWKHATGSASPICWRPRRSSAT